ncbi:MAG: 6-pyruvoyl tetrahydropterin synthase family protein [Thermoplasmata archaeon]|jgi:6-pyruvoyltetrahydropterin/6-carboxytetrahydropterin synthase|nr:MAG: 6-pyruvoyl tetrahydropterin synthase family protein [Thermoplasmata archaeon]RLF63317.1 MAG: 6-pyruvoyl tetrahydropterin synthase family protein [Thermoplasmata archaeon]
MKVKVDGWRSHIVFSSAHFIPDYERCGRLHGHSYAIHAVVEGEADEMGIVIDFGELKRAMKKIADEIDHHMIVPEKGEIEISRSNGEVEIIFGKKRYVFPEEDCIILPIDSSSAESLASYVLERIIEEMKMPENVREIEVGIDEGYGQGAWISKKMG